MALLSHLSLSSLLLSFVSFAVSSSSTVGDQVNSTQPSVVLDGATVIGQANETTGIIQYLGIPFAQPPYVDFCNVAHRRLSFCPDMGFMVQSRRPAPSPSAAYCIVQRNDQCNRLREPMHSTDPAEHDASEQPSFSRGSGRECASG